MAISPDGKWIYITAYNGGYYTGSWEGFGWKYAVMRMPFDGSQPPTAWLGEIDKRGKEEGKFCMPTSVACDAKGRVYVSDYMNNRIQVFGDDGKLQKSIPGGG